ncbi:MAG: hypothetical protein ACP5MX_03620 [Candidatus Micrarchaeia archaeon]
MIKMVANKNSGNGNGVLFLVYFLTWLTGIIFYVVGGKNNAKMRFHAMQAIYLGAIQIVLSIFFGLLGISTIGSAINLLILLYAWYLGIRAASGADIEIPTLGEYAKKAANYR